MSEQPDVKAMKADEPYFIEVDTNGCAVCGHGRTWMVVGPDDTAQSTSYECEEEAQKLADALNEAFWRGRTEPSLRK